MTEGPLCRFCGKPIAKHTTHEYLVAPENERYSIVRTVARRVDKLPQTKAEAQRLFNNQIVAVSRCRVTIDHDNDTKVDLGIDSVRLWDGKSYVDKFFCNGDHARRFGYVCAHDGRALRAYNEAIAARREKQDA